MTIVLVVPETSSPLLMVASIDDYGIASITVSHSNVLSLICDHSNGANTMNHDYQWHNLFQPSFIITAIPRNTADGRPLFTMIWRHEPLWYLSILAPSCQPFTKLMACFWAVKWITSIFVEHFLPACLCEWSPLNGSMHLSWSTIVDHQQASLSATNRHYPSWSSLLTIMFTIHH